jgi:hypothetical protein
LIDIPLNGQEKLRHTLDFIERQEVPSGKQLVRPLAGEFEYIEVIEGVEASPLCRREVLD